MQQGYLQAALVFVLQQICSWGWVLVSKEGRITLLGGLDVDPTRSGVAASIVFKKQGVRQWEMRYDDRTNTGMGRFVLANHEPRKVLAINDDGTAELDGASFTIGRPSLNQSQIFLGRSRAWRLFKGVYQGESMFELTDPLNRPRIRAHQRDGVTFFFKCIHPWGIPPGE